MPSRPRCSVFIASSLDGYIARPDGGLDWLSIVERAGEDYGYRQFFDSVDAVVMGRRTYDTVLGFDAWPYVGKRCIVLTHAPPPALRHDEAFATGAPAPLLERLAGEGVRRVYVDGGAVIRQFLAAGLVDDLTLSIIPVLLGGGIRLFDGDAVAATSPGSADRPLRLADARSFDSGLVQLRYQLGA
jgi:dihydrofolate reductase